MRNEEREKVCGKESGTGGRIHEKKHIQKTNNSVTAWTLELTYPYNPTVFKLWFLRHPVTTRLRWSYFEISSPHGPVTSSLSQRLLLMKVTRKATLWNSKFSQEAKTESPLLPFCCACSDLLLPNVDWISSFPKFTLLDPYLPKCPIYFSIP